MNTTEVQPVRLNNRYNVQGNAFKHQRAFNDISVILTKSTAGMSHYVQDSGGNPDLEVNVE
jgi:hypothetical protein